MSSPKGSVTTITASSAPAWLALIGRACRLRPTGAGAAPPPLFGFANPAIYAQAVTASFTYVLAAHTVDCASRRLRGTASTRSDGLVYSLRTFQPGLSPDQGPCWDDVTGVGSRPRATSQPSRLTH